MQHAVRPTAATLLLIASAAALLAGCSGEAVTTAIGLPTSETAGPHGQTGATPPGPRPPNGQSNALVVTSQQRAYLDALNAAGVQPTSDLLALSIGSYVCQARAAKQNEQAVFDMVLPLVRDDVRDERQNFLDPPVPPPPAADVNAATADYIRIATERLC